MRFFLRKYKLLVLIVFCLNSVILYAQSYKKDSLQIKGYTVIEYQNNELKNIKLLRVLCDYCSDVQKNAIGNEVERRAYEEVLDPKNRIKDGKKKLAIYIRISKKDFKAINEN